MPASGVCKKPFPDMSGAFFSCHLSRVDTAISGFLSARRRKKVLFFRPVWFCDACPVRIGHGMVKSRANRLGESENT
jgi:hypothetical protein